MIDITGINAVLKVLDSMRDKKEVEASDKPFSEYLEEELEKNAAVEKAREEEQKKQADAINKEAEDKEAAKKKMRSSMDRLNGYKDKEDKEDKEDKKEEDK